MKKLLFLITLLFSIPCFADTPTTAPQLLTTLLQHVTGVSEFTSHGQVKMQFLDGIVQIGHYQSDYILALDGGVSNSVAPDDQGHVAATFGVHLHVISFLNNFFKINPSLGQTLQMIEATPRYSYDADVHHGVLGFTFGAQIPFQ
jgi:hypothetical protein